MSQSYRIDLPMQVTVIDDGWKFVVGNKRSTPDGEELIENTVREVGFGVEYFGKFECFL